MIAQFGIIFAKHKRHENFILCPALAIQIPKQ